MRIPVHRTYDYGSHPHQTQTEFFGCGDLENPSRIKIRRGRTPTLLQVTNMDITVSSKCFLSL
jgi:hypothetical protein